jgi:hypothetical protein
VRQFFMLCHTVDDLVDGDRAVSRSDVCAALWLAMSQIPRNPFFLAYRDRLQPVIDVAILNWFTANELEERGGVHSRNISWTLRCSILDVIIAAAACVGGDGWAMKIGVDVRLYCQRGSLSDYLDECERQHGAAPDPETDHA